MSKARITLRMEESDIELLKCKFGTENTSEAIRLAMLNCLNQKEENFYLRSAECVYDRGGLPVTVYHICVRLGK